jgi:hypothetical protein
LSFLVLLFLPFFSFASTSTTDASSTLPAVEEFFYFDPANSGEPGVSILSGSTLYEYNNAGDNESTNILGTQWQAQTFTPAISYTITSVKLKLKKPGVDPPGNFDVVIRATIDGLPSGGDLASGSMLAADIDSSATWYEITLGTGASLDAENIYAIICSVPGATESGIYWRINYKNAVDQYIGGKHKTSVDSGVNWGDGYGDYTDAMFENWGIPTTPPLLPVPLEPIFFMYFYNLGDYLPVIFAFVLVVILVAGFLNVILELDRRKEKSKITYQRKGPI